MQTMRAIGSISVLPMMVLVLGCNERGGGRTPTDPALDPRNAEASFSHEGSRRGDDGSGSHFRLFGSARMTRDPENPSNIVLEINSAAGPGGAIRELRRVKIWQLDHQLNFHRAFVAPHTCNAGSPRVQLFIDVNGDGRFQQAPDGPDVVAHGHVRPPWTACENGPVTPARGPMVSTLPWRFEDLTDELARWEITPGGVIPLVNVPGAPYANWDALEAAVGALPNHQVIRGMLVVDFLGDVPPGIAYYDLLTIFDLTLGTRGQWQPEGRDHDDDSEN